MYGERMLLVLLASAVALLSPLLAWAQISGSNCGKSYETENWADALKEGTGIRLRHAQRGVDRYPLLFRQGRYCRSEYRRSDEDDGHVLPRRHRVAVMATTTVAAAMTMQPTRRICA